MVDVGRQSHFWERTGREPQDSISYLEGVLEHPGSSQIHFSAWRYYVGNWGRRTGKTLAAAAEVCWEATKPGARVWIIAPTYELTDRVFEYVHRWIVGDRVLDKIAGTNQVKSHSFSEKGQRYIKFKNGGFIRCRSAESGANVGEQLDLIVMDEAARIHPLVWEQDLEPTTIDRKGRVLFISTPRGRNWFYDLHERQKAHETYQKGWRSSTFRTWDNPFNDPSWIRSKEAETTPDVFRREYGASFEHFEGLIYSKYRDSYHDFENPGMGGHLFNPRELELPLNRMTLYRAGDVGSEHPTVWGIAAVGAIHHKNFHGHEDDVWLFRRYGGESNVSHPEHARALTRISGSLPIYDTFISPDAKRTHKVNDDPELNKSIWDVYEDNGVLLTAANNDYDYGVDTVKAYLASTLNANTSRGRFFISEDLKGTRDGFLGYTWKAPHHRMGQEVDSPQRPRKYKDDDMDMVRYLLASNPCFVDPRITGQYRELQSDQERYGHPRRPAGNPRSRPGRVRVMGGLRG